LFSFFAATVEMGKEGKDSDVESFGEDDRLNEGGNEDANDSHVIKISIHPETVRQVQYVNFYFMVAFAALISWREVFVDGKDKDGKMVVGSGLARLHNSDLIRAFGYNNICIFWDYDPATWMTAMIYPFVDLPMLSYVALNWLRQKRDCDRRLISTELFNVMTFLHAIEFLLLMWFRMIFVNKAFENVSMHTAPFEGFQIAMSMNAVMNLVYYSYAEIKYGDGIQAKVFGSPDSLRRKLAKLYAAATIIVTAVKQFLGWTLICRVEGWFCKDMGLNPTLPRDRAIGQFFDIAWFFLVAVFPFLLTFWLKKNSEPLEFTVKVGKPGLV
jgi:hypothetical protein